jgi:signal transduction histidine kinase
VLNASQSISKEIRLDQLLTRLMQLVLENAGAQRGLLLLEKDGQLVVEAEHLAARAGLIERWSVSLETYQELPLSVIHYVARTNEPLTLHDAAQEDPFAKDPYIVRKHSKSMLCAPILSQGQSLGLIYLENDVAVGAFTLERLEIVKLLSSQAAISLKNADLYQSVEAAKEQLENVNKTLELKVEERTQELQRRNQELEIANEQVREAARRKSQFLAGMSHELRTPMNAILGFTRLVLRRVGDLVPERQRDNLLKVIESANQLLGLINQLLDLSRLEAGRMEVHPSFFNARQCLLDCYEMVSVSPLVKPAVQVCCEIAEHVSNVQTDEEGLRHIVLNLLSNAVKFTDRGEVRVSATVEDQPGGEPALVIIIADTGVGIPTEALGSIFEEFQQVEGGVRKREGTGLGLPIARRWVERLGGVISVESEIGKGSTFTVVIPTVYQAEKQLAVGGAL